MQKMYDPRNRILPSCFRQRPYHEPLASLAKRIKMANTLKAAKKPGKTTSLQRNPSKKKKQLIAETQDSIYSS